MLLSGWLCRTGNSGLWLLEGLCLLAGNILKRRDRANVRRWLPRIRLGVCSHSGSRRRVRVPGARRDTHSIQVDLVFGFPSPKERSPRSIERKPLPRGRYAIGRTFVEQSVTVLADPFGATPSQERRGSCANRNGAAGSPSADGASPAVIQNAPTSREKVGDDISMKSDAAA